MKRKFIHKVEPHRAQGDSISNEYFDRKSYFVNVRRITFHHIKLKKSFITLITDS